MGVKTRFDPHTVELMALVGMALVGMALVGMALVGMALAGVALGYRWWGGAGGVALGAARGVVPVVCGVVRPRHQQASQRGTDVRQRSRNEGGVRADRT